MVVPGIDMFNWEAERLHNWKTQEVVPEPKHGRKTRKATVRGRGDEHGERYRRYAEELKLLQKFEVSKKVLHKLGVV